MSQSCNITLEDVRRLLEEDRSIRRFDASRPVGVELLRRLVDLTRYCASGRNAQPLRYILVTSPTACDAIFPTLAWAGYYKDWDGPAKEERPTAYLVQCLDTTLGQNCLCDDGLQLQAITLGATAAGVAGCIIKAFNGPRLVEVLDLPSRYQPRYVVALGYRAEEARLVEMPADGDFKYFRDEADCQCVPKRSLSQLIIGER